MKGKNQGNKGKKIIPEFKAGSYQVTIKVNQQRNPNAINTFIHDEKSIENLAHQFSVASHHLETKHNVDFQNFDDYDERMKRLVFFAVSNKLTKSMSARQANARLTDLNTIASTKVSLPVVLHPIIDGLGSFLENNESWEMNGQACLAFNYFLRAVQTSVPAGPGGQVAVEQLQLSDYFINTKWDNPCKPLIEVMRGYVNSWAATQGTIRIGMDAGQLTMKVPYLERGFAAYSALVQTVQKPGYILRALQIGVVLETIDDRVPFGFFQQDANVLNAQRVFLVNYGREELGKMAGMFNEQIISRLEGTVSYGFQWSNECTFRNVGSQWQVCRSETDFRGTSPLNIPAAQLEMAFMMGTESNGWVRANDPSSLTSNDFRFDLITKFIKKAEKKGG